MAKGSLGHGGGGQMGVMLGAFGRRGTHASHQDAGLSLRGCLG